MAAYQYVFVMKGLGKTYSGGRQVLRDIWLSFFPGAKIGVIGLNGAGKSTLLRVMAGIEKDFVGEAWAAEGVRVGFLPQEPELDPQLNVLLDPDTGPFGACSPTDGHAQHPPEPLPTNPADPRLWLGTAFSTSAAAAKAPDD